MVSHLCVWSHWKWDKFNHFNWSKILTFSLSTMVSKIFAMPPSGKFPTITLERLVLNWWFPGPTENHSNNNNNNNNKNNNFLHRLAFACLYTHFWTQNFLTNITGSTLFEKHLTHRLFTCYVLNFTANNYIAPTQMQFCHIPNNGLPKRKPSKTTSNNNLETNYREQNK